jgi:hypothetical protein
MQGDSSTSSPSRRENRVVACPDDAATWVKHGFGEISREALRPLYEELLESWVALEHLYSFKIGTKYLAKGTSRPVQVQDWIRDGRGWTQATRPITNIPQFETDWWAWWTELQPAWRGSRRGAVKTVAPEGADWGKLVVAGQNGLLSVVATLYWWGVAEKKGGVAASASWEEVVTDTTWVLRGLTNNSG